MCDADLTPKKVLLKIVLMFWSTIFFTLFPKCTRACQPASGPRAIKTKRTMPSLLKQWISASISQQPTAAAETTERTTADLIPLMHLLLFPTCQIKLNKSDQRPAL